MRFQDPLQSGVLLRRRMRFLADITLDTGATITAHTPNTGSMRGCATPGSRVYVSPSDRPGRKLPYTWELATDTGVLVGVHTGRTNDLLEEAVRAGLVPALTGYAERRREVAYGTGSRIDLLLDGHRDGAPRCYVEAKNVTLARSGVAYFPDAVTARGQKHLRELAAVVAAGFRAAMVFVVQRADCRAVRPAGDIDPAYTRALVAAHAAGVTLVGLRFAPSPDGIAFDTELPVELP